MYRATIRTGQPFSDIISESLPTKEAAEACADQWNVILDAAKVEIVFYSVQYWDERISEWVVAD